jgi:hypothetical protein
MTAMFGTTEGMPDGYAKVLLLTTMFGAVTPVCRRCGALIAPAGGDAKPTPFEAHDEFHAALEVRPNGG